MTPRFKRIVLTLVLIVPITFAPKASMSQWGGWENLGGIILEQPDCVSWTENRIDCFARGTNRAMYHRWWNGSAWGGWENLGGVLLDEPECVSWDPNRIDCFARGTNASMYHRWWNGSSWGGWENLGGQILESPSCVSWSANRIDCFARGTNRAMYHRWWNGSNWGGWENLGGILLDAPNCTSWGPNRIDCFARGLNRAMYHRWWNGSSWGGWENLGGTILDTPECVSWGPNRIDCFARGTSAAMYHRWWNGSSWGGWENLGGVILERPECTTWGANRIDCFARGTNRAMYHRWWNGSNWGGWENLGGVILEQPSCVSWGSGRLDCFARGTSAAMFHRWYTSGRTRSLTISRHSSVMLANATVDSILADASSVLQTNDGPGDIDCSITLARSGNVGTFTATDGSLDTSTETQTVFNLPGNVKVVDDVNFCGDFNTSYIGCGQTPGSSFITERFSENLEGILWAHEFGHNQGLPHRDTTTDNVMYFSIGANRLRVNQSECDAFRGSQPLIGAAVMAVTNTAEPDFAASMSTQKTSDTMLSAVTVAGVVMPMEEIAGDPMPTVIAAEQSMPTEQVAGGDMPQTPVDGEQMPDEASSSRPIPVEQFVQQIYFDGLPLDQAANYTENDAAVLLEMLADPEFVVFHENIALTLGMIGNADSIDPLINYVVNGPSGDDDIGALTSKELARPAYKGRVGSVIALGYLLNHTGSESALEFLVDSTSPQTWEVRGMTAKPERGQPEEDTLRDLSKYSIISLGLSGNEAAADHLESLMGGSAGALSAVEEIGENINDIVNQSLEIHQEVSQEGLVKYYEGVSH